MTEGMKYFTTLGHIFRITVVIFYVIVFAIGLVYAIAPRWMWKTFESWRAVREPSDAYFTARRIIGVIIMIVIVIAALTPTFIYLAH